MIRLVSEEAPIPLTERGRLVPILANPRAGSGNQLHVVEELARGLRRRSLDPWLCWRREDLSKLARSVPPEEVRCVVAAGGDGTLLEVLNRAPGVPVTPLPLGNENLVARFCAMPRSGTGVADVVATGRLRTVDLARVNGRLFALMASAGFDGEVVHRVHGRRRGHISKLNYVLPVLRALREYRYPRVEVELLDTGERLGGCLVYVFNLPQYALDLPIAREAEPDDGLLNVCIFERPGLWNLGRYLLAVAGGWQGALPDCQRRQARRVRLTSSEQVPVQTDGDPAGWLTATVEVVPRGMTLAVPPHHG